MRKLMIISATALCMIGCKPTEKNYQEAYDLAIQKKTEALTSVNGGMLDAMDGTHKQVVGNDTIFVVSGSFKTHEASGDTTVLRGKIGIAVSKYGMDTNAKRHASDMSEKYPGAFVATDGKKSYYVVVERCANIQEAVPAIHKFEEDNPSFHYIALPSPCAILLRD